MAVDELISESEAKDLCHVVVSVCQMMWKSGLAL